jgi:hypothetical protein
MPKQESMSLPRAARALGEAAWWAVLVWLAPATVVARAADACAMRAGDLRAGRGRDGSGPTHRRASRRAR